MSAEREISAAEQGADTNALGHWIEVCPPKLIACATVAADVVCEAARPPGESW